MRQLLAILTFLIIPSPAFSINFSGLDDIHDNDHVLPGQPVFYYHGNSQGSVGALTDASGIVEEHYTYSMLGRPQILDDDGVTPLDTSTMGNHYMFQGLYHDAETASYHARNRQYDPLTGRYRTIDPLGNWMHGQGGSKSAYGEDPWNMGDPMGLNPALVPVGIGARELLRRALIALAGWLCADKAVDKVKDIPLPAPRVESFPVSTQPARRLEGFCASSKTFRRRADRLLATVPESGGEIPSHILYLRQGEHFLTYYGRSKRSSESSA